MVYEEHPEGGPAINGKTESKTPDLAGWEIVGCYASCFIYASGDMRRLIDLNAGTAVAEYRLTERKEKGK